jgi:hypothetical protein
MRQQQELTTRICELLETKKNSLLERHKHLMEVDFIKLGSGTTIARQVWIANVEMAISVAKVARGNFCTQETLLLLRTPVVKTSSHLRHKEVPSQTHSKHTGSSTKTKPRTTSPRHTARSARLSKASYFFSLCVLVMLLGGQSEEFDQSKPRRYHPRTGMECLTLDWP